MMKKILLTGDDGYNSIGTRLLIHALRDNYDLTVVGTKTQQTAVGGKLNVREGASFLETKIDGIRTFCIGGSPADAMEFSRAQFGINTFDFLLSGINMGENVGCGIISSGTVSAALRGFGWELAPKAIALSWTTPPEFFFMKHDETEDLGTYIQYPGEVAQKTLELCFEKELWGAQMLNVNFPKSPSKKVRFARFTQSLNACYPAVTILEDSKTFIYPFVPADRASEPLTSDVGALEKGYVAITPLNPDWTDEKLYSELKEREIFL